MAHRVAVKGSSLPASLLRLAGFLPDDDLVAEVFRSRRGNVLNIKLGDPMRLGDLDLTSDLIGGAHRRDSRGQRVGRSR